MVYSISLFEFQDDHLHLFFYDPDHNDPPGDIHPDVIQWMEENTPDYEIDETSELFITTIHFKSEESLTKFKKQYRITI